MTTTAQFHAPEPIYFDFALLRRGLRLFALVALLIAPFARDPLVIAACGIVPWILVGIIDRPGMPAIVVYYLLFVWVQAAARVLLASIDGESLSDGFYGPDVYRAFFYSMVALVVLATTFRISLQALPDVPAEQLHEHLSWRPLTVFWLYLATFALSFALAPLAALSSAIAQPLVAVGSLKFVVMFMLFATVLATGNGVNLLLMVLLLEVISGFSGLFSGFKTVFIVLGLTALSLRMSLRPTNIAAGIVTIGLLFGLGLFWTAVKADYRGMATGYSDAQYITSSMSDRLGLLADKAIHPEAIDWGQAADQLLRRISYIDFFGASISVSETSPEPVVLARWRDALEHVAMPRLLFPDKAALDDTEVFVRYVRPESGDDSNKGTSISIGFLAENFIDFGFPGMLAPIAVMGFLLGGIMRYFMTRPVAWVVREGFVTALVLTLSAGMELSLAKYLGGCIMTFVVLALCLKFLYSTVVRWIAN